MVRALAGQVNVAGNGYLDVSDTTIGGPVVLAAGGYGVYLRDAAYRFGVFFSSAGSGRTLS